MKYEVTNIQYDTDGEEIDLPSTLIINVPEDTIDFENYISDEISNVTGFCTYGFNINKIIQINYFIFREKGGNKTIDVIIEDGGVASSFKIDEFYKTEYYQNRITKDTEFEDLWFDLSEGKMSSKEWIELNDPTEDELINDMLNWLYFSGNIEFIRYDMGEMTEENFNIIKTKLNLSNN